MRCDVAITGGGLGGLALALGLARRGVHAVVLEARARPPADRWGFMLWPPGTRVLDWLGVGDQVADAGQPLESMDWRNQTGASWLNVDLSALAPFGRFIGVRPSRVETVLDRAATEAGVEIHKEARVESVVLDGQARLRVQSRAVDHLEARILVGADGPLSRVRSAIGLHMRKMPLPGQAVVTGIGGRLPFFGLRQAVGSGWAVSAVPVERGPFVDRGHGLWIHGPVGDRAVRSKRRSGA